MGGSEPTGRHSGTNADRLSGRQHQCLELVALGYTSKQIARELRISPSTVDNHLSAALERLGMNSRADAARALQARVSAAQPDVVDEPASAPVPNANTRPSQKTSILREALQLPPLGGAENRLSLRRRYVHVIQIALLGTMAMTAVVMTIAGLVQLFSR